MPSQKPSVPVVIRRENGDDRVVDLFSRLMEDRTIFLNGPISTEMSHIIIAQLMYLDNEAPGQDIKMYINSPGGEISAGMAIYDAMKSIRSKVITICSGMAASMGAFLLASGDRRMALPSAEMMIHQPSGGIQGVATEVEIEARRIIRMRQRLNELLSAMTGQPLERIKEDSDRDFWMTADEAQKYGLIDEVMPPARK